MSLAVGEGCPALDRPSGTGYYGLGFRFSGDSDENAEIAVPDLQHDRIHD